MRANNQIHAISKRTLNLHGFRIHVNFMRDKMTIYDSIKDQRMEKLKLKIVVRYESYVSMNLKIDDILNVWLY